MLIPTTILTNKYSTAVVASLPVSPSDNDEIFLQVGSGDTAILWHLKYDADITDAYKWRYVGGPPLYANFDGGFPEGTSGSTLSGTYVELNSGQPAVTIPAVGIYDISHGAQIARNGAVYGLANVKSNGTNPVNDADAVELRGEASAIGNTWSHPARTFRRTIPSIATSAVVVQVYRTDGATNYFGSSWLEVRPVRIG